VDLPFSFAAIETQEALLPALGELSLEGCNLGDSVAINVTKAPGGVLEEATPPRPTLKLLGQLFPSLTSLNLAYNQLSSASLTDEVLQTLLFQTEGAEGSSKSRRGLRHLNLRGNKIDTLDCLGQFAARFKNGEEMPEWRLKELDVQENCITKLTPELGFLPLSAFLVEGNL
jgi:Leucine-rich repeat (LRR) protein